MWLLNVNTRKLEYFEGNTIPPYAILSHRWEDDEVTFQDIQSGRGTDKKGYRKIDLCCRQAARQLEQVRSKPRPLSYAWIDTCCIDKTNSAELSEAINSMYKWYNQSAECYAYLSDVKGDIGNASSSIERSAWFERGWTLQELLAPKSVVFYNFRWIDLGSKHELASQISEITGIPVECIQYFDLNTLSSRSTAEIMSWAASRITTREEDQAYSLLGLFNVNMPLIYGEGKRAFHRLQEEILKVTADLTIFAWKAADDDQKNSISFFADSPLNFGHNNSPIQRLHLEHSEHYDGFQVPAGPFLTGNGLSIHLELVPICRDVYLAPICEYPTRGEYKSHGIMLKRGWGNIFWRCYGDDGQCLFEVPEIDTSWQCQTSTITLAKTRLVPGGSRYLEKRRYKAFEIDTSQLLCQSTHFGLDDMVQDHRRLSIVASHHGITDIIRLELSETISRFVLFGNDFECRPFCLFVCPDPVPRKGSTLEVVQVSVPRLQMLGLSIWASRDMMMLVKELQAKKDQSWEVLKDHVEFHSMQWRTPCAIFNISSGEVIMFSVEVNTVHVTMKSAAQLAKQAKFVASPEFGRWHKRQRIT